MTDRKKLADDVGRKAMGSPLSKRDPLLSIQQLADRWGWSPSKIRRLAKAGKIPHVVIARRYYFEEAALDQWLADRRVAGQSAVGSVTPVRTRRSHEEECARLGIEPYHQFSGFHRPS